MNQKARTLAERYAGILSQWPGVECVSLNEAAGAPLFNPNFALILDIYYRDAIPSPAERSRLFGAGVSAFETSEHGEKDRFFAGELPMRFEYKTLDKIEELVSLADTRQDALWLIKDSGTYGYYRLANGEILFSRGGWIDGIRARLAALDDGFWRQMRARSQSKMEHLLCDLGAALVNEDGFHYLVSEALFIKTACLTLFSINRRFEPSHRAYARQVLELPILPESFRAQFETFTGEGAEIGLDRKFSLAQLIAKEITALP